MTNRRIIVCANCGKERGHSAFGLCRSCYGRQYRASNGGRVVTCTACGLVKLHYGKSLCRPCYRLTRSEKRSAYKRGWNERNQKHTQRYMYAWQQENRERRKAYMRQWWRGNPTKKSAYRACRKARMNALPNTLTCEEAEKLRAIGEAMYPGEKLHLDHMVPLSRGGGTTRANMHAIPALLNGRKFNKLPEEIYRQTQLWQNLMVEKRALIVM